SLRQLHWWQIRPTGSIFTSDTTLNVANGSLFRLPLRVPAGWEVEPVETTPASSLRQSMVTGEGGHNTLVLEWDGGIGPSSGARISSLNLRIRMRSEFAAEFPPAG